MSNDLVMVCLKQKETFRCVSHLFNSFLSLGLLVMGIRSIVVICRAKKEIKYEIMSMCIAILSVTQTLDIIDNMV